MALGNRPFLIATTLIASPILLLTASLSSGKSPTVVFAVGQEEDPSPRVKQVVGKQPTRRSDGSARSRRSAPSPASGLLGGGLLGELFGGDDSRHKRPRRARVPQPPSVEEVQRNGSINWDGIPYHEADPKTPSRASQPIRDPDENQSARIIRGGARTVEASPSASSTRLAPAPVRKRAVPSPTPANDPSVPQRPSEAGDSEVGDDQELTPLSRNVSSRRSSRRRVESLADAVPSASDRVADLSRALSGSSENEKSTSRRNTRNQAKQEGTDLVPPKVARRTMPAPSATRDGTSATSQHADRAAANPDFASKNVSSRRTVPSAGVSSRRNTNQQPEEPSSSPGGRPDRFEPMEAIAENDSRDVGEAGDSSRVGQPNLNNSTPSQEIASVVRSSNEPDASGDPGRPADLSPTLASPSQTAGGDTDPGRRTSIQSVEDETAAETHQARAADNGLSNGTDKQHTREVSMPPSLGRPGSAPSAMPEETSTASELPGIRVTTRGPRQIMIRQTSPFEIRVENRGAIDAEGVLVRTLVPKWAGIEGHEVTAGNVTVVTEGSARRLTWKIDRLAAGRTARLLLQVKASRSGALALDVDWTLTPRKSVAEMQVREPKLELSIDGPEKVVYGQSQTYQIRVLNPGDGIAPDVVFTLSPNSPTPQSQRIGDIPPGKEAQFEVQLTAKERGELKIDGLAVGGLELRAEAAKTIQVSAAKLEAVLAGPELQYQNTQAHYRLEVQNAGDAASDEVVATLRLPAGVEYQGGIDGARQRGGELRWTIDSLSPGAVRRFDFDCQMNSTGDQRIAFECSGSAAGEAEVSIATRVKAIADLVLTVNDPPAPAPVGNEVTYEIRIRNRGSKEATDVEAVAQFSHGIEPIRTEGRGGNVMEGQVLFDAIPRIDAGDEVRLRVIAKADQVGSHRFRCEVRGGETVLVAEEATRYMNTGGQRVSRRSSDSETR